MSSIGDRLPLNLRNPLGDAGEQLGRAVGSLIDAEADKLLKVVRAVSLWGWCDSVEDCSLYAVRWFLDAKDEIR